MLLIDEKLIVYDNEIFLVASVRFFFLFLILHSMRYED